MKKTIMVLLLLLIQPLSINASNLDYIVTNEISGTTNGVFYNTISAKVYNDSGSESVQNISVLKPDESLSTTIWSYFDDNGKLINKDVPSIARDFEAKHPNYEVVAGVNGDYFTTGETINANMIFGSNLVKSVNHSKYFSVELDRKGHFVDTHKQMTTKEYKAYAYDKDTNALLKVVDLLPINSRNVGSNETAIFYNYSSINNGAIDHYVFDLAMKTTTNNNFFFLMDSPARKIDPIETTILKVSLITKDLQLRNLIDDGAYIKVQKVVDKIEESHTMIGVDSMIIDNGIEREFSEIVGQSEDYIKYRHPRTGLGFDEFNQPILITVDGRQAGFSNGVNLREFAKIMKENGIVKGFNLDGGGSTQAIIKEDGVFKMFNRPSEGAPASYRGVSNAVLIIKPKVAATVDVEIINEKIQVTLPSLDYDILINGSKVSPNSLVSTHDLNTKIDTAISIISKGIVKMSVFEKAVYKSYVKVPIMPTFTVNHELKGSGLDLLVNFDDPDLLIDRMYVILKQTGVNKVALVQYQGLRKAVFPEIVEGLNHFDIYYELSDGQKKELTYEFTYEIEKEELPSTENPARNNKLLILTVSGVFGAFMLVGLGFIIFKRYKQ